MFIVTLSSISLLPATCCYVVNGMCQLQQLLLRPWVKLLHVILPPVHGFNSMWASSCLFPAITIGTSCMATRFPSIPWHTIGLGFGIPITYSSGQTQSQTVNRYPPSPASQSLRNGLWYKLKSSKLLSSVSQSDLHVCLVLSATFIIQWLNGLLHKQWC